MLLAPHRLRHLREAQPVGIERVVLQARLLAPATQQSVHQLEARGLGVQCAGLQQRQRLRAQAQRRGAFLGLGPHPFGIHREGQVARRHAEGQVAPRLAPEAVEIGLVREHRLVRLPEHQSKRLACAGCTRCTRCASEADSSVRPGV